MLSADIDLAVVFLLWVGRVGRGGLGAGNFLNCLGSWGGYWLCAELDDLSWGFWGGGGLTWGWREVWEVCRLSLGKGAVLRRHDFD